MSGALGSGPAPSGHELRPAGDLKAATAVRLRSAMSWAVLVLLCAGLGACLAAGTTGGYGVEGAAGGSVALYQPAEPPLRACRCPRRAPYPAAASEVRAPAFGRCRG